MKFGVVVFPGSNCDSDLIHVIQNVLGFEVEKLWHKTKSLNDLTIDDCILVPGGFSYGDYLRSGSIATLSPIMSSVLDFASKGGTVVGICNGFQILCEANLLPGVLLPNDSQKFICKNIYLKTETTKSPLSKNITDNQIVRIPIAHAEGRYFANHAIIDELEKNNQVIFRYSDSHGQLTADSNPNGSINNIAGICNIQRNVIGLMPHPERASESILGNSDGLIMFESLVNHLLYRLQLLA